MDYQVRRKRLKQTLRRRKIDALLVSQPENRRYLSGFTASDHAISESSGFLFIPARGKSRLLTDFRYQLQAERETDLPVQIYQKGMVRLLRAVIGELNCKRIGFEDQYTLYSTGTQFNKISTELEITFIPLSGLIERMREIKSEAEIALIRNSVALNETVFQSVFKRLSPDMREIDVAIEIETAMRRSGASAPSFDTIVAAGNNSALPHAVPTTTKLGSSQPITIDMGLVLEGYCSDMTRNFVLERADERYLAIHRLVRTAQRAAIERVRAGVTAREVDRAARSLINEAGYGKFFRHSLGHGVGLAVHENPRVSMNSRKKLRAGMVITIEPGIYLPDWGGVRLENMVVVHEEGCELLNHDVTWLDR